MLDLIPPELLWEITRKLDIKDILNLELTSKDIAYKLIQCSITRKRIASYRKLCCHVCGVRFPSYVCNNWSTSTMRLLKTPGSRKSTIDKAVRWYYYDDPVWVHRDCAYCQLAQSGNSGYSISFLHLYKQPTPNRRPVCDNGKYETKTNNQRYLVVNTIYSLNDTSPLDI